MKEHNLLYLVVPCYNEQEVLPETHRRLGQKLESLCARGLFPPKAGCCLWMTAAVTSHGG